MYQKAKQDNDNKNSLQPWQPVAEEKQTSKGVVLVWAGTMPAVGIRVASLKIPSKRVDVQVEVQVVQRKARPRSLFFRLAFVIPETKQKTVFDLSNVELRERH